MGIFFFRDHLLGVGSHRSTRTHWRAAGPSLEGSWVGRPTQHQGAAQSQSCKCWTAHSPWSQAFQRWSVPLSSEHLVQHVPPDPDPAEPFVSKDMAGGTCADHVTKSWVTKVLLPGTSVSPTQRWTQIHCRMRHLNWQIHLLNSSNVKVTIYKSDAVEQYFTNFLSQAPE